MILVTFWPIETSFVCVRFEVFVRIRVRILVLWVMTTFCHNPVQYVFTLWYCLKVMVYFFYGRLLPTLEFRQCFILSWINIVPICILNLICICGMNFLPFSKQKIYITQVYIYFMYYLYPFLTAYFYMKSKIIKLKILLTLHCIRSLKFGCWFENNSHLFSLNYLYIHDSDWFFISQWL